METGVKGGAIMDAGYKVLSNKKWFGPGYCGICGQRDPDSTYSPLIPKMVRYWCPDDGWKTGVLCSGCAEDCKDRGPRRGDYAYQDASNGETIDSLNEVLGDDQDGFHSELEDFGITKYRGGHR